MDPLFLSTKRAHWNCVRYGLPLLAKHGLTPARFELLRNLYEREDMSADQSWVRKALGVARSTLSVMVRALEKLGLIKREPSLWDRRTRKCVLTLEGKQRVAAALSELVWSKVVARVVEQALTYAGQHPCDVAAERDTAEFLLLRIRLLLYFSRGLECAFDV
jgi:DNA-binding MarR family transcriptional regulator